MDQYGLRHTQRKVYYEELAHMMKEAAKFYDLWSASCRPKNVNGINQGKSEGLRTRGEVKVA